MRIKFIIPFPFGPEGIARRAAEIPREALGSDVEVDCVAVKNSPASGASPYDSMLLEMYIGEAGISAEEEGYDAVVMDTVSDAAIEALRSRLTIPVVGPGITMYTIAQLLGRRFGIMAYLDEHRFHYERNLRLYGILDKCASIRAFNMPHDVEELFGERRDEILARILEAGRLAVDDDGADVIVLGSTAMHEAGDYLSKHLGVPVINPGPTAIKVAEMLVSLGLSHSKVAYPAPPVVQDEKWHSLMAATDSEYYRDFLNSAKTS